MLLAAIAWWKVLAYVVIAVVAILCFALFAAHVYAMADRRKD